jgi:hypothetical protein
MEMMKSYHARETRRKEEVNIGHLNDTLQLIIPNSYSIMLSISNHSLNLIISNPTKTKESAKTNWLEWRSYLPRAISHTFLFKTGEGGSGSRGGGLGRRHGRGELKLGLGSEVGK